MSSAETTARRQLQALERVRAVVEAPRLWVLPDGRLPNSAKRPDDFATLEAREERRG